MGATRTPTKSFFTGLLGWRPKRRADNSMTTDLPAPKLIPRKGKSKFRNIRVEYDGIKFDSKRECAYYQELKLLEAAGDISQLRVHPKDFNITINNKRICRYEPDFIFYDNKQGRFRIQDVKGVVTALFKLKKKLVEATYDIEVEIIKWHRQQDFNY